MRTEVPRIRVTRHENGAVSIHGLPEGTERLTVKHLSGYFPSSVRRSLRRTYGIHLGDSVERLVACGVLSPQELADYLSLLCYRRFSTEGISDLGREPMFIAAGDTIYRLAPIKQIQATKALAVLRAKATETLKAEKEEILKQATHRAHQITTEAQRVLQQATDRERIIRQQSKDFRIPLGLTNQNIKLQRESVLVLQTAAFKFTNFRYENYLWNALNAVPVYAKIWIAFSSTFSEILWRVCATYEGYLPHMSPESACIEVGDNHRVSFEMLSDSREAARVLFSATQAIQRAFETVNLASLYSSVDLWDERFLPFLPSAFRESLFNLDHSPEEYGTVEEFLDENFPPPDSKISQEAPQWTIAGSNS